jgi:2-dehydro-3-deoxygluconokinase
VTPADVSAIGEALLRLSVRPGERLEDAPAFEVHVAGSEANVAYALARIGLRSAWTSVLPANPLGRRVAATLAAGGVDVSNVVWSPTGRLATYYVELGSAPRPTRVVYDRTGTPMAAATPDLFDWDRVCAARAIHLSGITTALSAAAHTLVDTAIAEARRRGRLVSFDVNYRQRLWSAAEAARSLAAIGPLVDVVIATTEDARDLLGIAGPATDSVRRLSDALGVATTVLTCGADGAVLLHEGEVHERPGAAVEPVDRIGAGDAFAAGFLAGWLDGSPIAGLERGLAMSALKMTLRGDLFRFSHEDVEELLAGPLREVRR